MEYYEINEIKVMDWEEDMYCVAVKNKNGIYKPIWVDEDKEKCIKHAIELNNSNNPIKNIYKGGKKK